VSQNHKRILIVDDEERVLFVLRETIKRMHAGYEIMTASDGRAALEAFTDAPADLLITDLRMPGMDGVALTEAVRDRDTNVIVIWISAFGCRQVRHAAKRLNVYRCMNKPLEIQEIRGAVREALQS
jgi:DNA-binding NtrC family response regulator